MLHLELENDHEPQLYTTIEFPFHEKQQGRTEKGLHLLLHSPIISQNKNTFSCEEC